MKKTTAKTKGGKKSTYDMIQDATSIQKAIAAKLDDMGKTRYWLAKECGMMPCQVYMALSRRGTTVETIEKLANRLGMSLKA